MACSFAQPSILAYFVLLTSEEVYTLNGFQRCSPISPTFYLERFISKSLCAGSMHPSITSCFSDTCKILSSFVFPSIIIIYIASEYEQVFIMIFVRILILTVLFSGEVIHFQWWNTFLSIHLGLIALLKIISSLSKMRPYFSHLSNLSSLCILL